MPRQGEKCDGIILIETFGKRSTTHGLPDRNFDGERNLSIDCDDLRYIRRYLLIVGQWYPEEWSSTRKNLYHVWQALVTIGVWCHFVYSFGIFGVKTLEWQNLTWFPISAFEEFVWELRWVIQHHIGLYYFCRKRHLETFLKESCLTRDLWAETCRYLKRICQAIVVLVFCIPVSLRPAELSYSVEPDDVSKIILDTILLALDRLFTTPIFLIFILVAYLLVRVVKGYGENIKIWPRNYKNVEGSGLRKAKLQFKEIKSLIRSVENAFQVYLSVHFLLLLITAFLGVFACVEQFETEVATNHSYLTAGSPKYYRRMNVKPKLIIPPAKIKMVAIEPKDSVNNSSVPLPFQELYRTQKENKTQSQDEQIIHVTAGIAGHADERQVLVEVGIEAVLRILESIVLYMVPLTLMLRLQTKLRLVRLAIVDCDPFEQNDNGFLFQDEETVRSMDEYVATCTGFTIFGFKMPLFRTFLLSAFAPFLTAVTTFLFSYIHVKRR